MENFPSRRNSGNIWLGFLLLIIGGGLFVQQLNLPVPDWLFSWKTLLITIGVFMGLRSNFEGTGWPFPIIIGCLFLIGDIVPDIHWHQYGWPVALIIFGIFLILRPRRNWRRGQNLDLKNYSDVSGEKFSNEDYISHTAVFGSVEKTILSKDFRGGSLTTFFGGTELNLIQADINGKVILDVTQIFGGTKLLVPSNWEVKSEMVAVFGGIEDKRMQQGATNPSKVLIIRGTTVFGGLEIVSY